MGDNRDNAFDSRFPGTIKREDIWVELCIAIGELRPRGGTLTSQTSREEQRPPKAMSQPCAVDI